MIGKLIIIITAVLILTQGAGAYIDDSTVLETFPDGQAKVGIINGKTVEWNSYGQPLKIDGAPTLILSFSDDVNTDELYVYTENGEIISFKNRLISLNSDEWTGWHAYAIPSNKIPRELPPFKKAGIDAKEYQRTYGVDRAYLQDAKNYQTIYDNLYKLTPEYQAEENTRLRLELEATKSRLNATEESVPEIQENVARLNETVTQHSTWFNSIFNWIYENFGIDLR